MTVVITASTDKNQNSVITVKDQHGQRTIDLPTPGSEADHSAEQREEHLINGHLTSPGPMVVNADIEAPERLATFVEHEGKPSALAHHEAKLSTPLQEQLINDHLTSPGPMVVSADIEDPETPANFVKHEDKLSAPVQEKDKPSALPHDEAKLSTPVQEQDETPALVPMRVDTDDSLLPPSTRLQRYLKETDELIVCPGVYDGFSARIAISVGYKAMYMVRCVYDPSQLRNEH